ncbi:hypothetical protein A1OE_1197 [Candidatus Endolissoclinum faulkneri L2]|uniref:Uncharacterized protein n=1 Tax=Candidatus Endolissoclinum faulkneri L2 TaxID=1193729 RepID=K7Z5N4_9PROT|nr:hypothetical protein A1OE_1197 [Candidatus Endolissoclinum faulkneri L2]
MRLKVLSLFRIISTKGYFTNRKINLLHVTIGYKIIRMKIYTRIPNYSFA